MSIDVNISKSLVPGRETRLIFSNISCENIHLLELVVKNTKENQKDEQFSKIYVSDLDDGVDSEKVAKIINESFPGVEINISLKQKIAQNASQSSESKEEKKGTQSQLPNLKNYRDPKSKFKDVTQTKDNSQAVTKTPGPNLNSCRR